MKVINKEVTKHWGNEIWIEDGTRTPYALKRIFFKAGKQTSLQVHQYKIETNHVIAGYGILFYSELPFDIDAYLKNGLDDVDAYIATLSKQSLSPGTSFTILPGIVHRVIANTDLAFVEASTPELDDVIRLADDQNRPNGRIDSEHH